MDVCAGVALVWSPAGGQGVRSEGSSGGCSRRAVGRGQL